MNDLRYELMDVDKLIPYVNNARTHSAEQVNKLAGSIKEFGFINPVIIDGDNGILAGHGRVMAAKQLGLKKVPCVAADYLTEAQRKAYILADNKMALDAGWDNELLKVEIESLQEMGFDLEFTGFDEKELADLFASDNEAKEDNFDVDAELEKPCFSKTGDVWQLGRHRVICGDSTNLETYKRLMGDTKANLVCTDPPYFVKLKSTSGTIKNDNLSDEEGVKFLMEAFSCMHESMAKDASIYVF